MEAPQFWAVTNGTGKKLAARHHGVDYVWNPDEELTVPHEAAQHIFGVMVEDKIPALHRLGWLTATGDMEQALEKLRTQIKFSPVRQVFEMAPARVKRGRRAAVSSDRSLANADGSEGADSSAPNETGDDDGREAVEF